MLFVLALLVVAVSARWEVFHSGGSPVYNTDLNAIPSGRRNSAFWNYNNNLYIFGGKDKNSRTNDLWKYELNTRRWFWQPNTVLESRSGSSQWSSGGLLWMYGGRNDTKTFHGLNDFWSYNPETREWKEYNFSPNPGPRYGSYFWQDDENNYLYLFGGKSDSNTILDDIWRFDTKAENWESVTFSGKELPSRDDGVAVQINEYVYFFEGKEFLRLDMKAQTVESISSEGQYPEMREDFIMWSNEDKIHLFGGRVNSKFYGDFWTFDLEENSWTLNSEITPSARWGSGFGIYEGDLYMFGGQPKDTTSLSNELWIFTNKNTEVTQIQTSNNPSDIYSIVVTNLAFTSFLVISLCVGLIFLYFKKHKSENNIKVEHVPKNDFGLSVNL